MLRIIRDLSFQPCGRRTNISLALEYLQRIARRRTVSFVVSDFLATDYERPLRMARRRHDIIPISITDRRVLSLPRLGFMTLQDLETGALVLVDSNSMVVQQQYQQRRHAAVAQRQRLFQFLGLDAIDVYTDVSYITPLVRFFRARERRR